MFFTAQTNPAIREDQKDRACDAVNALAAVSLAKAKSTITAEKIGDMIESGEFVIPDEFLEVLAKLAKGGEDYPSHIVVAAGMVAEMAVDAAIALAKQIEDREIEQMATDIYTHDNLYY